MVLHIDERLCRSAGRQRAQTTPPIQPKNVIAVQDIIIERGSKIRITVQPRSAFRGGTEQHGEQHVQQHIEYTSRRRSTRRAAVLLCCPWFTREWRESISERKAAGYYEE